MSETRDQKRFTISEVAADWHELMILQRIMWPSVACVSEQLDPRFAASRHTTAQSATRGLLVVVVVNIMSDCRCAVCTGLTVVLLVPVPVEPRSVCCRRQSTSANICARNESTSNCRTMYGGYTVQERWVS